MNTKNRGRCTAAKHTQRPVHQSPDKTKTILEPTSLSDKALVVLGVLSIPGILPAVLLPLCGVLSDLLPGGIGLFISTLLFVGIIAFVIWAIDK